MIQELNQELNKANLTQAIIAGLQGQAEVLLAEKITSKADYEAVDRFRKDVKNYRLAGEKIFEHEIAERNRLHKEAIAKKKEVLAPIVDVENKAKARVFEWEYEQEQAAKRAEEERLRAIEERKTALMELGYMLKEGVWTLEAVSVDAEEVLKAGYEKWTNLFRSLRMHGEEVAAAKAEAIRLQEEEAARLLKEKQELEAREAALKEAEAKVRASVNEARLYELTSTGCIDGNYIVTDANAMTMVSLTDLWSLDSEWWDRYIEQAKRTKVLRDEFLAKQQAEQAAARARQELINTRVARLKEVEWGLKTDVLYSPDHDEELSKPIEMMVMGTPNGLRRVSVDDIHDMSIVDFEALVKEGEEEKVRLKAAQEEYIRQQERDRIAKEAADKAEAERLATEQRIAMDGDKELVRQSLVVIQNAGSKLKEIVPQVKTKAVKDKVEQTVEMLRQAYAELGRL